MSDRIEGISDQVEQALNTVQDRYAAVGRLLSDPAVLGHPAERQRLAREQAQLSAVVKASAEYRQATRQLEEAQQLLKDPRVELALRAMAESEVKALGQRRLALEKQLMALLVPRDSRDGNNAFLEVRAGTGGGEAALFAADLFRMYAKYAEQQGWRVEVMASHETGLGGFKEVVLAVEGRGVYGRLKYERGVHRVQRVPQTEAGGRIHTSTVTVAVLPEAEEVEVKIDPKDLRIETFCSSGPGGQSVNTTHSAVRVTHLPTGLVVSCQDERSQLKNRTKAMRVLRSRLLELEEARQQAAIARERRAQVGSGERSEKVRTYNVPQNRVTDHRIGLTLHRLDRVLEGDLDEIIESLQAAAARQRLADEAPASDAADAG